MQEQRKVTNKVFAITTARTDEKERGRKDIVQQKLHHGASATMNARRAIPILTWRGCATGHYYVLLYHKGRKEQTSSCLHLDVSLPFLCSILSVVFPDVSSPRLLNLGVARRARSSLTWHVVKSQQASFMSAYVADAR